MSKFDKSKKNGQQSRYQRQMGASRSKSSMNPSLADQEWEDRKKEFKEQKRKDNEAVDLKLGYPRFDTPGEVKEAWAYQMLATTVKAEDGTQRSGLDIFFLTDAKETFKSTVIYAPYFYVAVEDAGVTQDVSQFLLRKYEGNGITVEKVDLEDLDLPNHLSGLKREYLKLSFLNSDDMMTVRRDILPLVRKKQDLEGTRHDSTQTTLRGTSTSTFANHQQAKLTNQSNMLESICDIREYDISYVVRCCIDLHIRAGHYYRVEPQQDKNVKVTFLDEKTKNTKATPRVLAYDIECTKAPLKFPDASHDQIFMISYMVDGQGYLIISRDIVSQDIDDFEYTPKPSFPGPFKIFNEKNEEDLIRRFFAHVQQLRPQIIVTYNGDFFDFPFLEARAEKIGLNMTKEWGIEKQGEEYRGRSMIHLDAFSWVRRDSYLPQGAQGLKAVTKYKLGYDPVEVDPEDMVRYASEKPVHMASYSVSDAVATFYLYDQYVHLFIFSLCTLIPMGPEDVLRKGSGTLCEALLMVEAYNNNIVCPNKDVEPFTKFHNGHLLEAETYIGGHVECLETGVYRSDIPCKFNLTPTALQKLIDNIDRDLTFFIEVEKGVERSTITNYDEVRSEIVEKLENLRDNPVREEEPFIYHLDVGAMYPNIILTNRLQPHAISNQATCACGYQGHGGCKREMDWIWRGDYAPASKSEYDRTKMQLTQHNEKIDDKTFLEYDAKEQAAIVAKRVKQYSHKVYKKTKETKEETRSATVCMRENPFYVDTVRNFRDRRYNFKKMTKTWKNNVKKEQKNGDPVAIKHAQDMMLVYDSLQVAHKCILNSFYGYVMRKGARWRSMEMAGIVTLTGAKLIKQARELVEQIGRPLELDTDGIWCVLPISFPNNFTFKTQDGGKEILEYPCCMLNSDVHDRYTNHQYQNLDPKTGKYTTRSECSIFFEVDGPYKAMILPASTEEGKLLKKRYAVYNFDGSLAELKGFELKRRGELELIKAFQSEVFVRFLHGKSLPECYDAVADIANHWLDVLDGQGETLDDEELVGLISENKSMSRQLEDYGDQKGTSLTTAKRLGEFLGKEMVQDKGLNCKFVIAERPYGAPVTERAIPVAIWKAEPAVMKNYLRKWLKDSSLDDFDMRNILDWEYYRERLTKTIQKIITIPAALQHVANPVPRCAHPEWLQRLVKRENDSHQQVKLTDMFGALKKGQKNKSVFGEKMITNVAVSPLPVSTAPAGKLTLTTTNSQTTTVTPDKNKRVSLVSPDSPSTTYVGRKSFNQWLKTRKGAWGLARKTAKRERNAGLFEGVNSSSSNISKKAKKNTGVEGFLKEAERNVRDGSWQVLEVRETDTLGEVILFVMTTPTSITKIPLTINRKVHVSLSGEGGEVVEQLRQSSKGKLRKGWYLPHGGGSEEEELWELTVSEAKFQPYLSTLLTMPEIKSVYSTEYPLISDFLRDVGGVGRVVAGGDSGKWKLDDLEGVKGRCYLGEGSARFKRIFLFSKLLQSRGLLSVFFPISMASTSAVPEPESNDISGSCIIYVLKPKGNKERSVKGKYCEGMFQKLLEYVKSSPEVDEEEREWYKTLTGSCTFTVKYMNEEQDVWNSVNGDLLEYIQGKNGPTMLVGKGCGGVKELKVKLKTVNEFPVVSFDDDTSPLPAMQWEMPAVNSALMSFFNTCALDFPRLLAQSRYGNVPIGNTTAGGLYDVFLSRGLKKGRTISWASNKPSPDLGSAANDDGLFTDAESVVKICNEGVYRGVCFEINVNGLVAACLRSMEVGINESVSRSVNILQNLVKTWHQEAVRNPVARVMAEGVWKMLNEQERTLWDGEVGRVVANMGWVGFSRLIGEIEHLGGEIVFADFHKVIISTGKKTVAEGLEYVEFIVRTLRGYDDIVGEIGLRVNSVWSDLVFVDENNYEAVEFEMVGTEEEGDVGDRVVDVGGEKWCYHMRSRWNLVNFFADESHQHYFRSLIGRFSRAPFEKRLKLLLAGGEDVQEVAVQEKELEFKKNYVRKQMAVTFTKYVGEILATSVDVVWPSLPGSHLAPTTPALEFVKSVVKVLFLDRDVSAEATILKKSALTQMGMHEYSEQCKWVDPCASFVLPNVFCDGCDSCVNLNLCVKGEEDGGWFCEECGSEYDKGFIEWRLVEMMNKKSVQYQVQDLRCPKTNAVAKGYMGVVSETCSVWRGDFDRERYVRDLGVLRRIAEGFELEWLGETVEGLLA